MDITLHNSFSEHWMFQENRTFSRFEAWCDLLFLTADKDTEVIIRGTIFQIQKGQLIASLDQLAKRWKWDRNKVYRYLILLEKKNMIKRGSREKTEQITICYSGCYDTKTNSDETVTKQKTTTKKIKNNSLNPQVNRPTIDDLKSYFQDNGYSENAASTAFNYYDEADWIDSNGKQVLNWKQKCRIVFFKPENKIQDDLKASEEEIYKLDNETKTHLETLTTAVKNSPTFMQMIYDECVSIDKRINNEKYREFLNNFVRAKRTEDVVFNPVDFRKHLRYHVLKQANEFKQKNSPQFGK